MPHDGPRPWAPRLRPSKPPRRRPFPRLASRLRSRPVRPSLRDRESRLRATNLFPCRSQKGHCKSPISDVVEITRPGRMYRFVSSQRRYGCIQVDGTAEIVRFDLGVLRHFNVDLLEDFFSAKDRGPDPAVDVCYRRTNPVRVSVVCKFFLCFFSSEDFKLL